MKSLRGTRVVLPLALLLFGSVSASGQTSRQEQASSPSPSPIGWLRIVDTFQRPSDEPGRTVIGVLLRLNPVNDVDGGWPLYRSPTPSYLVTRETFPSDGRLRDDSGAVDSCSFLNEESADFPDEFADARSMKLLDALHPDALQPLYGPRDDNDPAGPYWWEGWLTWQVASGNDVCMYRYTVDFSDGPLQTEDRLNLTTGEIEEGLTLEDARSHARGEDRYVGAWRFVTGDGDRLFD